MTVKIGDEMAHGAFGRRLRCAREYLSIANYGEALFWLGMALPSVWDAYKSGDQYRAERVVMRLHHRVVRRIREAQWVACRQKERAIWRGERE